MTHSNSKITELPNGKAKAEYEIVAEFDAMECRDHISLICDHHFEREVLATSLRHVFPEAVIRCHDTTAEWELKRTNDGRPETVLYNIGDRSMADSDTKHDLRQFIEKAKNRRVIVISRSNDMMAVFDAIDCGATSYIPSNVGLEELVEAMRISSARSVVVPRSSMAALRQAIEHKTITKPGLEQHFTERQLSVAKALQRGSANKTIAYELGLCESTVKVHIRNIMRKLKATNRTQAAFRLNELANGSSEVSVLPDD